MISCGVDITLHGSVIDILGSREEDFGLMVRNLKQVIVEDTYGLN
jgi:hypothetical protein